MGHLPSHIICPTNSSLFSARGIFYVHLATEILLFPFSGSEVPMAELADSIVIDQLAGTTYDTKKVFPLCYY